MQTPPYGGVWRDMVAYCGPGETVTSFYTLVGERRNYQAKIAKYIFLLDI